MPSGNELVAQLLSRPSERPLQGSLRSLLYGLLLAVILLIGSVFYGGDGADHFVGFLAVGNALSFCGWGVERLWYSTIANMLKNPFSLAAYLTRIPFWYMAGGVGYSFGMLTAKKLGLLAVYDIPATHLFEAGGWIGVAFQVPLQVWVYRSLVKKVSEAIDR